MKLYEDYLLLRSHFSAIPEDQEIQITMDLLSSTLFCSTRNAKLIIIKMMDLRWISFTSGMGRGKTSLLTFHYSSREMLKQSYRVYARRWSCRRNPAIA